LNKHLDYLNFYFYNSRVSKSNFIYIFLSAEWEPRFTGYDGKLNVKVNEYKFLIGLPDCGKMQIWPVYHDPTVRNNYIKT
jgi:hypothetical protein